MSTSNWVTGMGGGAVSGASVGSTWGVPGAIIGGVLGAGIGALGASEADKNDEKLKASRVVNDPTTPYKIKLPSGAVVTMYAHGKPKQNYYNPNNSAAAGLAALNTTAALATSYKNGKGYDAGSGGYDAGSGGKTTNPLLLDPNSGATPTAIAPQGGPNYKGDLEAIKTGLDKPGDADYEKTWL